MRFFVRSGRALGFVSNLLREVTSCEGEAHRRVAEIESLIFVHDGVENLELFYFLV
ncbi:hypothetical protein ACNKHV_02810 [Shigella flexneri]